jgi:phosphopantothenoylcysteine decarboxylase / phosphopantothenate---cysteine ligase
VLAGKKIIMGISGSIAAYKAILLTRLLIKNGALVKVVMTPSATDFASPLVLETLSKNKVHVGLSDSSTWANHVELGRWADLMILAPASCNTIGKMAAGICDNLLLAVYLSAVCPVWVAPAMDEDMWKHAATRENLTRLQSWGTNILPVGSGDLASGLVGEGRMMEPEDIMDRVVLHFENSRDLQGKRAIVTAGPTYEPLDPVRFVGNHSSGRMGIEIAAELMKRGAATTLVLGPSSLAVPPGLEVVRVQTAIEMFEATKLRFAEQDVVVMAAAVADYRPSDIATEKIKKKDDTLQITLVKNPDILKYCGENKRESQLVVGFALETTNEASHAKEKLVSKNADLIVMNSLRDEGAGFGGTTNKVSIFDKEGKEYHYPVESKKMVAKRIVDLIAEKLA